MVDISIITVNLNDAEGLARTRKSLNYLKSDRFSFEWLVIDGASTDGSLVEANKPVEHAARVVVKSESDDGIYCAMNKGIGLSRGTYSIFMNSGDHFIDGASVLLDDFFIYRLDGIDVKVFGIRSLDGDKTVETRRFSSPEQLRKSPAVPHQSTLIRTQELVELGGYNVSYRLLSDYDLFCHLFKVGKSFDYTDKRELAIFKQGGSSSVAKNQLRVAQEAFAIQRNHFGRVCIPYGFALGVKYFLIKLKWLKPMDAIIRFIIFKKRRA